MAASTGPFHSTPEDEAYNAGTCRLLEQAYLGAGDPRGGSGFRGDEVRWERARRRLPHRANRIFVGNVMAWEPPLRFDFVCSNLEFVPHHRRQDMVERLLREYLVPGGRLILTSYGSSRRPQPTAEPVGEILRGWGYEVADELEGVDTNGVVITRVAWTDLPEA